MQVRAPPSTPSICKPKMIRAKQSKPVRTGRGIWQAGAHAARNHIKTFRSQKIQHPATFRRLDHKLSQLRLSAR